MAVTICLGTHFATVVPSFIINEELREAKSRVHICMLCPGPVNTNFNNVANVTFALPGISATYCASYALE